MDTNEQTTKLRETRERVLDRPLSLDADAEHSFRTEIVSSWQRCKLIGVTPTGEQVPYRPERERPNRLLRAAGPVIDRLAEQTEDGPLSILLADSEAQIIDRRAGGRALVKALDGALVAPGFHYAEEYTGTNGIGSALESAKPFLVSGAEHFRENLQEFTCIGSPVRHPINGQVAGILDVTCRVGDTHAVMKPLVLAAVREIESRLYADASRREQTLLEHFLQASRRAGSAAVVSLNEDIVMANTAASTMLDLSDQASLWDWACRMLGTGDEHTGEIRLAHGVAAQARARRLGENGSTSGVLVEMRPPARSDGRAPQARRCPPKRHSRDGAERLVGRSLAAARLRDDVDAALQADGPVLICGEPGAGKRFAATHLHRRRAGQEPLTVLDALLARDDPAAWAARVAGVLTDGATVLLRHLEALAPELAEHLEAIVDAAAPNRVIATARTRGEPTPAGRVLDHFPFSITAPPLRYRTEDIADLAPALLAAHTASGKPIPRLCPGTLRTLAALNWPGNLRELESVLATAAARSLGTDITHEHLPPEYRSSSRRAGEAALHRAERDTVIEALAETRGNKLAAAERLGVARSTLYRKIRTLGIDKNHLPAATTHE